MKWRFAWKTISFGWLEENQGLGISERDHILAYRLNYSAALCGDRSKTK